MATGDGLARVTYLPGAQPVPSSAVVDDAAPSVDPSAVDTLGRDSSERRAENVSLSALTRRGMSRWEMEKTLVSRDLDERVVQEELERLERVGLIDDAALAETYVRTQHERKGLGRAALMSELRRRHIPQESIDLALEQVDDDDEQSRATELAVKRAGQLSSYDQETAMRRLTGFLLRKGYSSSVVRNAVDAALRGRSSGVRFR
jgi:regulatory protein